jgi:hypothetical protein
VKTAAGLWPGRWGEGHGDCDRGAPTILHEDRRADPGIGRERVARYIPVGEGSSGIPVVKPSNPGLIRGRFANPARSFPELLQKCVHFYTLFPDTHFAPDLRRTGHFTWRCKTLMYANGKRNRRGVGGYRVAGKRTPVLISMLRRYFVNLGYQFNFLKNFFTARKSPKHCESFRPLNIQYAILKNH